MTLDIGESLPTSLFTFFLISIRLILKKPWPYIRTKFKSWKSWLTWTICASNIEGNISYLTLRNCCETKKLMSHTFFVKFRVFKREFLRNHSVYRAQIFRDNCNCYALSISWGFIFAPAGRFRPEGEIARRHPIVSRAYIRKVLTVEIYSRYAREKSRFAWTGAARNR